MTPNDLDLLDNHLALVLSDALAKGRIELGTGILVFADPEIKTRFISGGRLPRELWG